MATKPCPGIPGGSIESIALFFRLVRSICRTEGSGGFLEVSPKGKEIQGRLPSLTQLRSIAIFPRCAEMGRVLAIPLK